MSGDELLAFDEGRELSVYGKPHRHEVEFEMGESYKQFEKIAKRFEKTMGGALQTEEGKKALDALALAFGNPEISKIGMKLSEAVAEELDKELVEMSKVEEIEIEGQTVLEQLEELIDEYGYKDITVLVNKSDGHDKYWACAVRESDERLEMIRAWGGIGNAPSAKKEFINGSEFDAILDKKLKK